MAPVTASISRMPGPALGALRSGSRPRCRARSARPGWPRARPAPRRRPGPCPRSGCESMPATLTTPPLGAIEPRSTAMPPVGVDRGRTGGGRPCRRVQGGSRAARFSATVLPVTVRQSPCRSPASSSSRITTGTPPTRVHVHHVVLAVRLGVGDVRHAGRHPVEVVEGELDPRLVGDGEEVQHGVGRAAERHHHGDGVLEGLLGHDVAGPDVAGRAAR